MDATWELLQEEYDDEIKEDLEQDIVTFRNKSISLNYNYY